METDKTADCHQMKQEQKFTFKTPTSDNGIKEMWWNIDQPFCRIIIVVYCNFLLEFKQVVQSCLGVKDVY